MRRPARKHYLWGNTMSFSREIKDFLEAYSGLTKTFDASELSQAQAAHFRARTDDLKDPEKRAVALDLSRSRAADFRNRNSPEMVRFRGDKVRADIDRVKAGTNYIGAQQRFWEARNNPGAVPTPQPGGGSPVIVPPSAVETGRRPFDDVGDRELEETYSQGGMVRRYEDGGEVDDDVDPNTGDDLNVDPNDDGLPAEAFAQAREAANAGMMHNLESLGLHQPGSAVPGMPNPGRANAARNYATGANGAPPDQVMAVQRIVDPEGKMSESHRNVAALAAIYGYHMNRGDTRSAQAAAASMLQSYRAMSNRYIALARAAQEGGNVNDAMQAVLKAYSYIPDGKDLKLTRNQDGTITLTQTDEETGDVVDRRITTPDEFVSMATRGSMNDFDSILMAARGNSGSTRPGAVGGQRQGGNTRAGNVTLSNMDASRRTIDEAAGKIKNPKPPMARDNGEDVPLPADIVEQATERTKHIATQILARNTEMAPSQALQLAGSLTGSGEVRNIQKNQNGVTVTLDGQTVNLSNQSWQDITALRGILTTASTKAIADRRKRRELGEVGGMSRFTTNLAGAAVNPAVNAAARAAHRIPRAVRDIKRGVPEFSRDADAFVGAMGWAGREPDERVAQEED